MSGIEARRILRPGIVALLAPFITLACVSLGPMTIPRDCVEYVQALRDS